jgi:choline dehydrogenase-like flavoprotein
LPLAPAPDTARSQGSSSTRIQPSPQGFLSARERRIVGAIAEAAMPAGRVLEGGGADTALGVDQWLRESPRNAAQGIRAGLWSLELGVVPLKHRVFSSLPLQDRIEVLREWEQNRSYAARSMLRALLLPIKFAHFNRPEMFQHVGCRYESEAVREDRPRWLSRVTDGREIEEDLDLECEVVVIGTGAGGAAAAYELASRGRAVLMLEEGDYHRRSSFTARPSKAYKQLYRNQGMTVALGNIGVPIWAGRAVGGSTIINSGTCYRAPERTFESWRREFGLPGVFSNAGLGPYYERVEAMLQVTQASRLHVGAIGEIIARGAAHLGYTHDALHRNAPDCDGQGVCCFGCPTGAKRSTDVSYVPEALMRGAELVTAARVDFVDIVAGRARGVTATLGGGAPGARKRRLTVKAEVVVVAGGTLMTPLLLRRSGACKTSRMLGKNLSIHPASKVMALCDERVDQWKGIPQSYTIDHFAADGLLFEGGSLPFDVAALAVPWTGPRFMELMEQYPYLATFGFMIKDTSRGEVRQGPRGSPLIFYHLNEADTALMQRGFEILCEVFQAAGARRVLPLLAGHDEVSTRADLERLRASKLRPGDMEITAFHPLGTCRIGTRPEDSCLGPDHETHDVANLYVCDASAIPSSLGVNPQMTIMAMALRAAEIIDARLG